ncbi:MAG: hypothetical protein AAF198_09880 [Pseudomonadota bacterium]
MASDLERLKDIFKIWSSDKFKPLNAIRSKKRCLIINLNNADESTLSLFNSAVTDFEKSTSVFSEVVVTHAGLTGDKDFYLRNTNELKGEFGNVAGPNFLFFDSLEKAASYGGFTLLYELDCYPLVSGWLHKLDKIVAGNPKAWVIGSNYIGVRPLEDNITFHINGNALYNVGDPEFISFMNTVWKPSLFERARVKPYLAYDCWWSDIRNEAKRENNREWALVVAYSSRFVSTPFLINVLHESDFHADLKVVNSLERISGENHVLLHANFIHSDVLEFAKDRSKSTTLFEYLFKKSKSFGAKLSKHSPTSTDVSAREDFPKNKSTGKVRATDLQQIVRRLPESHSSASHLSQSGSDQFEALFPKVKKTWVTGVSKNVKSWYSKRLDLLGLSENQIKMMKAKKTSKGGPAITSTNGNDQRT